MSSPNYPDAEGLMAETAAIIDGAAQNLVGMDIYSDLEHDHPGIALSMRIGHIFDELEPGDNQGYEILEGLDPETGNYARLTRKTDFDAATGFRQEYIVQTGDERTYFFIGNDTEGDLQTTVTGTDIDMSASTEARLAELTAAVDYIETNFDLMDAKPAMTSGLDRAKPEIKAREINDISRAVDTLNEMFGKQSELSPNEDPDMLTGVDFQGREYSIARNTIQITDPDKQYDLNTINSTAFMIMTDVEGAHERYYRLEFYQDLFGDFRHEIDGSDFAEDQDEEARIAEIVSVVNQINTHAVLIPYVHKKD